MPHLERPSSFYRNSFLEATREFQSEGNYTELDIDDLALNFNRYIENWLARDHTPPRSGMVKESMFWLVDNANGSRQPEFIGRVSLRHELNAQLREFGGHIGYEIRPSRRREGNGTLGLRLVLSEARELGLDRVMITCDTTNIGSRKIIAANGGVLEDIIQNDFRDVPTMRWWIDLKGE
jgi:predicted acetyltransferase